MECPFVTSNPQKLIESDLIDAVIISVPNRFHKPLAISALQCGKDVLLEKPMALDQKECQEINLAATKSGCILQVGFVCRYLPAVMTSMQIIKAGRIGKISHIKASRYRRCGIPGLGKWFTTKADSGGGAMIDIGSHLIDMVLYLLGFPKPIRITGSSYSIFGRRTKDYIYDFMWAGPPAFDGIFDVEDSAYALVHFEQGITMQLDAAWAGNLSQKHLHDTVAILGDKGGLFFDPTLNGKHVSLFTQQHGRNVDIVLKLPQVNAYQKQLSSFVQAVETREPPHVSGQHGQNVQLIVDAIYKSNEESRELFLDNK